MHAWVVMWILLPTTSLAENHESPPPLASTRCEVNGHEMFSEHSGWLTEMESGDLNGHGIIIIYCNASLYPGRFPEHEA